MIKVELLAHTNVHPIDLASHAAGICYQDTMPILGKRMDDIEGKLFKKSHHTPFQHHSMTFTVEGIAVGDITFGMHLASPFYNSDQRSGRFCAKMFLNPDYDKIKNYIRKFWWNISSSALVMAMDYIKEGVNLYHANIATATEVAGNFVAEERPFASNKIKANIPKYAQEQTRMSIPVIFPTAFDFTINDTALVAMYESAWTPVMRYVTGEMARLFVEKYPETAFMFNEDRRRKSDWAITIKDTRMLGVRYKPVFELISLEVDVFKPETFCPSDKSIMHPVDRLHFTPEMMENSVNGIKAKIEVSTATNGQDQRHRAMRRGTPKFTGNFYIPPILKELKLEKKAIELMNRWLEVSKDIPDTLAMMLAPYGAMVSYTKSGSFNATAHEQCKRSCRSAQEEISELGRLQRLAIEERLGKDSPLLSMFKPPCYEEGICSEGDGYCGRDVGIRKTGDYFPKRKI
ncbi:MAG: FAD-dependent thymidylate synthase [Patescibacteria group bacterium]